MVHGAHPTADKAPRLVLPGSLGWLGAAGGLLAASTMVPGCHLDEAQAERLHLGMPLLATLVFSCVGVVLLRWLSTSPRTLAIAAGASASALVFFSAGSALLFDQEPKSVALAFAFLGALYAGLVAATLFVANEARRPLPAAAWAHRVVAAAAGSIGPLAILYWRAYERPVVGWLATAAWLQTVLACAVLALITVREGRAVAELDQAIGRGVRHAPAGAAAEVATALIVHKNAHGFARRLLTIAVLSSLVSLLVWRNLPTPPPPSTGVFDAWN